MAKKNIGLRVSQKVLTREAKKAHLELKSLKQDVI
jgi:hypothetical protein